MFDEIFQKLLQNFAKICKFDISGLNFLSLQLQFLKFHFNLVYFSTKWLNLTILIEEVVCTWHIIYFLKIGRYDLTLCKMQTKNDRIIKITSKFVNIKVVKVWYTTTLSESNNNEHISKVSVKFCKNSANLIFLVCKIYNKISIFKFLAFYMFFVPV